MTVEDEFHNQLDQLTDILGPASKGAGQDAAEFIAAMRDRDPAELEALRRKAWEEPQ